MQSANVCLHDTALHQMLIGLQRVFGLAETLLFQVGWKAAGIENSTVMRGTVLDLIGIATHATHNCTNMSKETYAKPREHICIT